MADDNESIVQLFGVIQTSIIDLRSDLQESMRKLEHRMAALEKRQSAAVHFDGATLTHLASIHGRMDSFRAALARSHGSLAETH